MQTSHLSDREFCDYFIAETEREKELLARLNSLLDENISHEDHVCTNDDCDLCDDKDGEIEELELSVEKLKEKIDDAKNFIDCGKIESARNVLET